MAKIELKNIKHTYKSGKKETCALRGINLTFEEGCAGAFLGPSGCGKTTLLNILSGLLKPSSGKVLFDGKDVTDLPPEGRNIAQLFQFPVIYDSMDVFGNLAFPLRNRGVLKKEIEKRVREIADLLDLSNVLYTSPKALGPGERQLVALGRGIVRKDTTVILLDEPMTQIDPQQRWVLRRELSKVQSNLKVTMIYVTHDQYEALTFAEKIVVMRDGLVVQVGIPEELYQNPETPFVGYFIGTPGMNVLDCSLIDKVLEFGEFSISISSEMKSKLERHGPKFRLGIRPEFIQCSTEKEKDWVSFKVKVAEDMGDHKILTLTSGSTSIKSRVPKETIVSEGGKVWVNFPEGKVKIYKNDVLIL